MFPNGLPTPPEVVQAVGQAATQLGPSILQQVQQGFLNPEGDHISIGFQFGPSVSLAPGASGGGGLGAQLEVVFDYRRNDVGLFVSPAAGGQLNLGAVEGTGRLSGMGAWGTVASFGDPNQDVLQSWSGWFTNVSYGAQVGAADIVGAAVSTGGSFYRSGQFNLTRPLVSYTPPLGAGTHTVAGTPGTTGRVETLDLGEVRFGSQQSNAEAAPGGPAAMDRAAQMVQSGSNPQAPGTIMGVSVVGEASRIWQRPRPGSTRATENANLAEARAQSVRSGLAQRLGSQPPVTAHGAGDQRAQHDGRPVTDGSAAYRRAVIFADASVGGTPGTPDRQEPNRMEIGVSVPNPFTTARTAWGWDTTVGVTGLAGGAAVAGVYGGAGVSYSFPLGKAHFSAATMNEIRWAVGINKILLDFMSLSPLALIRDIVALARGGVAADTEPAMTRGVTDWAIPLPPGVAVA
jgi:hypothetical protein